MTRRRKLKSSQRRRKDVRRHAEFRALHRLGVGLEAIEARIKANNYKPWLKVSHTRTLCTCTIDNKLIPFIFSNKMREIVTVLSEDDLPHYEAKGLDLKQVRGE